MTTSSHDDSQIDETMIDLLRVELEAQIKVLNNGLVSLEKSENVANEIESLMRAVHSIKGAARIVALEPLVKLSHSLEDCFIGIRNKNIILEREDLNLMFQVVDLFSKTAKMPFHEISDQFVQKKVEIDDLINKLGKLSSKEDHQAKIPANAEQISTTQQKDFDSFGDRILRITAKKFDRLMGLAGESMVDSRRLVPFGKSLYQLKKLQSELAHYFDSVTDNIKKTKIGEQLGEDLTILRRKISECREVLNSRLVELDLVISRQTSLTNRLYREVTTSRMRPISDGIEGFPRMVRDVSNRFNKKIKFEIVGQSTLVDREILEKLEAPLSHLLQNAIDHGIETSDERALAGKPPEGIIRLEASHKAGALYISVSDDGRGIDPEMIRRQIIQRNLAKEEELLPMNEGQLLEFLFMPSFSTIEKVTDISGRGVGLDIVQNMVHEVGGNIHIINEKGKGITFNLKLPLTLSIIRVLIVNIAGEPYALPLARIGQTLRLSRDEIESFEDEPFFNLNGKVVYLIFANEILGLKQVSKFFNMYSVVIIGERSNLYGLVVDSFLEEKEIVVQELDERFGKIPNISAGSFMEDGSPILIVNVEEIIRFLVPS